MNPTVYYQHKLSEKEISYDPQQEAVVAKLQIIYDRLIRESWTDKIKEKIGKRNIVKGIYLWGEVGIGKTFLMDVFYHCLPLKNKLRLHFHQFMDMVHNKLTELQGEQDPLKRIAKFLAKEAKVICFDEFTVIDIADAMLLANLLKALFDQGICFLATSNIYPDELYKKGLQRQRFIPAIELIKKYTDVIHLKSLKDYRLDHLEVSAYYFYPLNQLSEIEMQKCFNRFSNSYECVDKPLLINHREIKFKKRAGRVIWFNFLDICSIPRSQKDYLSIVKEFDTIFVSNVTVIAADQFNLARAFINMIDVFYDAKIRLIISAEVSAEQIYPHGRLLFEYVRTVSRLIEMQSADYILDV